MPGREVPKFRSSEGNFVVVAVQDASKTRELHSQLEGISFPVAVFVDG